MLLDSGIYWNLPRLSHNVIENYMSFCVIQATDGAYVARFLGDHIILPYLVTTLWQNGECDN